MFLQKYLDEAATNKGGRKQRVRVRSDSYSYSELNPPADAPKWTIAGYNGPLKKKVQLHCSDNNGEENDETGTEDNTSSHEREEPKKKKKRRK